MLTTINTQIRTLTYDLAKLERIVEERRRKLTEAQHDLWKVRETLHGLHAMAELAAHRELETGLST